MSISDKTAIFEQITQKIFPKAKLIEFRALEGGVSAQVTLLNIELEDGGTKQLVVRQYGKANLENNPHAAKHEVSLLKLLQMHNLPVPAPIYADESNAILPSPYAVVSFIDGMTVDAPDNIGDFVRQMAQVLAKIHSIKPSSEISFLHNQTEAFTHKLNDPPAVLDDTLREGYIRDTLRAAWPLTEINEPRILHGDFWPGNTMWKDAQLVGVIDWEDAMIGDPLADLGNGRLEILMFFGPEATEAFTAEYQSLMPSLDYSNLPYWDLCAALRPAGKMSGWGLDKETLQKLQNGHKLFVDRAIDRLPTPYSS